MKLFDFLMVLDSIIIGLGLAEVLTGLGQLLRSRGGTRVYWVHAAFVALIFGTLLQHWWDAWGLRETGQLSFPGLLLFVSGPVLRFLLAYLAFPHSVAGSDLKEYYYRHAPVLWGLAALYLATTIVFRPIVMDWQILSPQNLLRALGLLLFLVLTVSKREAVHAFGIAVTSFLFVLYVFFFSFLQSE